MYSNENEKDVVNSGNNAESINNLKGENTMDNNNQNLNEEYTEEELQAMEDLKNVVVNAGNTRNQGHQFVTDSPPAGKYTARIVEALCTKNEDENYEFVTLSLEIESGTYAGSKVKKYYHPKTESAIIYFIKDVRKMGVQIAEDTEISEICFSLKDTRVSITVHYQPAGNISVCINGKSQPKATVAVDFRAIWKSALNKLAAEKQK